MAARAFCETEAPGGDAGAEFAGQGVALPVATSVAPRCDRM